MSFEVHSFSSCHIFGATMHRNRHGVCSKIMAQAAYALIPLVAVVETVFAAVITALAGIIYPLNSMPFVHTLVADEKSARQILKSRNLMAIPQGAVC